MYDIAIIVSGPAGLSACIYGLRAGKKVVVIEKNHEGTGQVEESGRVDNYLGLPGMTGLEMGTQFRNHAVKFGAEFIEAEAVSLCKEGNEWKIALADGNAIVSKTAIYAGGAAHRHLDAKGEQELAGCGVSYCATCDGSFYKGADVVVVGGGDTAIDDALYLSEIAHKVTIVHRRDSFRSEQKAVEILRNKDNVEFMLGYVVEEIVGDGEVQAVVLKKTDSDENVTIDAEGIFIAVGMIPSTQILNGVADLDSQGYVIAGEDCKTSAEGLFAAGDVRTKQLRQVVTAVSDGANAVTSALKLLA